MLLDEREKTHGDYNKTAMISQILKAVVREYSDDMEPIMMESLDMICTKISRILSGSASEKDHWIDIAGYAELVYRKL